MVSEPELKLTACGHAAVASRTSIRPTPRPLLHALSFLLPCDEFQHTCRDSADLRFLRASASPRFNSLVVWLGSVCAATASLRPRWLRVPCRLRPTCPAKLTPGSGEGVRGCEPGGRRLPAPRSPPGPLPPRQARSPGGSTVGRRRRAAPGRHRRYRRKSGGCPPPARSSSIAACCPGWPGCKWGPRRGTCCPPAAPESGLATRASLAGSRERGLWKCWGPG